MSMRRAAPGDDPGRAPPKIEIAPPFMVGACYTIFNVGGGIFPRIVIYKNHDHFLQYLTWCNILLVT